MKVSQTQCKVKPATVMNKHQTSEAFSPLTETGNGGICCNFPLFFCYKLLHFLSFTPPPKSISCLIADEV